jgi:Uma2 family endonuclease
MGMPQATQRWTADMVRALPDDGNRYEVIAGELFVTPAPSFDHQAAVYRLLLRLGPFVDAQRLGYALASPADIEFDEADLVQPDVFVTPRIEGRRPRRWSEVKALLVAVEVLSPSTARADRAVKRRLFQRVGVPEYWIVDVEARLVERWRPGDERPEIVTESLAWRPTAAAEPLVIDLPKLFSEILEG